MVFLNALRLLQMSDNTYIQFDLLPSEFYENSELAELAYNPDLPQFALNIHTQNKHLKGVEKQH